MVFMTTNFAGFLLDRGAFFWVIATSPLAVQQPVIAVAIGFHCRIVGQLRVFTACSFPMITILLAHFSYRYGRSRKSAGEVYRSDRGLAAW